MNVYSNKLSNASGDHSPSQDSHSSLYNRQNHHIIKNYNMYNNKSLISTPTGYQGNTT
eukprot:UN26681